MKKLLLLFIIPFLSFGQAPITQENISIAVDDWLIDPVLAEETYGHISDWDVSSVTSMNSLFQGASSFNEDISSWNVSNVTEMMWLFQEADSFNQDIGDWDVSNVVSMYMMFHEADSFNQDIGDWNVSNVVLMAAVFLGADSFNQDIGDWDVSSVNNMSSLFNSAVSFNQDIGSWNVSSVTNFDSMFAGATLSTANYDALLCGWSQLNLSNDEELLGDGDLFDGGFSTYCNCSEARQYIIDTFGWTIGDGGLDEDCNETEIEEFLSTKSIIKTTDILGREKNSKGFNIEIYDDGSVDKKYIIE